MGGAYIFDFLKDILPILSGLLGVLGVLNVFKTTNNRLSFWGWMAILIIFVSTMATLLLAKKDKEESDREKRQLQGKIDNIQKDIVKVREPIGDVSLSFWSLLPDSNVKVKEYKDYLKGKIESKIEDDMFHNPPIVNKDLSGTILDVNGNVAIYDVNKKSKYWPSKRFSAIGTLASTFSVTFCINSTHVEPTKIRFIMGGGGNGLDWCALGILPEPSTIFYDVKKDRIGLITTIKYDKKFVYSNGNITSVRDFFNSDVFFALPSSDSESLNDYLKMKKAPQSVFYSNKIQAELISGMEAGSILIEMGNGQSFNISGKHLTRYNTKDGTSFLFIKTLSTAKAMYELAPKD